MKLKDIIDEITALRNERSYRAALQISKLLDNNRRLFAGKINDLDLDFMMKNFEELSYSHPKDHNTPGFIRDYDKYFESLLFHLNKIV
ncbi:MAG: hypothetical protein ABIP51_00895 [Bacteroidia bacterium]